MATTGSSQDFNGSVHNKSGFDILNDATLNKGTAFSEEERTALGLHGLLPPHVRTLEEQVSRRLEALDRLDNDLQRYAFLRELQDTNEVLFYAVVVSDIPRMLPIVYTPTVGLGCQRFSHVYARPRGLFLSPPHIERIDAILSNPRFDSVEAVVVTDGERILGLGDQGAGGMGIPIGKLALYTACGGISPSATLPVLLDVGTDNQELLGDPLYIGWRHARIRGARYDEFVEAFVAAVQRRWPRVLLQWEDFAISNATRLLEKYRDRLCTFNDDIQGTAAVAAAAVLSAVYASGRPLSEERIVIFGAGTAGCGIAALMSKLLMQQGLSEMAARSRFVLVDRNGLAMDTTEGLFDFQKAFAMSSAEAERLGLGQNSSLEEIIVRSKAGVLIGTSGKYGAFDERTIRAMAAACSRPVILPLSNPTSRCEATPADLIAWSDGRAIVGTGSPFPPIEIAGIGRRIDQTNNVYIFPGLALGVLAIGATRITDGMLIAAAEALADASPARQGYDNILPPVRDIRAVARVVALAVANAAVREGIATRAEDVESAVDSKMWTPIYR